MKPENGQTARWLLIHVGDLLTIATVAILMLIGGIQSYQREQTLLANQHIVISNQRIILRNQKRILELHPAYERRAERDGGH